MKEDLTNSAISRKNILNNRDALMKVDQHLNLEGIYFKNEKIFTKNQVAELFNISDVTIERYISSHLNELRESGYTVLKGKELSELKSIASGSLINEGTKITVLGIFSFRAILNLGMLLTESERAKELRSKILDIVLEMMVQKTGGNTTYINQRDEEYLPSAVQEESYRDKFTSAIDQYIEVNSWKYANFTNYIYQSIFKEDAKEYRDILKLSNNTKIRETFYSEILDLIASFENGFAYELKNKYDELKRKLTLSEGKELFNKFSTHPSFEPLINQARTKMASRDLCFRDALHNKLEQYIESVPEADFERFLGEKSKALEERLHDPEVLAVFKRLKDK